MHYYFHLRRSGRVELDEIGLDFLSDSKATAEARRALAEMLLDASRAGREFNGQIEIKDATGRQIGVVNC